MGSKMATKYKVGDKIKIAKSDAFSDEVGLVCVVIDMMPPDSSFVCRVLHKPTNWNCLMYSWEIEKIPSYAKGEQLLFPFMEQEDEI